MIEVFLIDGDEKFSFNFTYLDFTILLERRDFAEKCKNADGGDDYAKGEDDVSFFITTA